MAGRIEVLVGERGVYPTVLDLTLGAVGKKHRLELSLTPKVLFLRDVDSLSLERNIF